MLCCFGFRGRSGLLQRPGLRASLVVEEEFAGGSDRKEDSAAAAASAQKDKGSVAVVVPSSTTLTSLPRPRSVIPFVRVDGGSRGKGTISRGEEQSSEAIATLLGVAERDTRILLPPSSPAAPPPPAALLVRRRQPRGSGGGAGNDRDTLLLVALEGVRLSIDCDKGVAFVFSCPARPRGALDGCREPSLDDPLVAELADAARAASSSACSSSCAPAALMLECALEAVSLALEERASALEAEAAAAGDALLACIGGSGRGGKKSSSKAKAKAAGTTVLTTREALEGLRRVKGELSDLRAAAARVTGALAPSRSRQRALGVSPSSHASGGRRSRNQKQQEQQQCRRRGGGGPLPPASRHSSTWYEEAAEAAAARAGAAGSSAEASSAGARGAEAAARLTLRRMALFM